MATTQVTTTPLMRPAFLEFHNSGEHILRARQIFTHWDEPLDYSVVEQYQEKKNIATLEIQILAPMDVLLISQLIR